MKNKSLLDQIKNTLSFGDFKIIYLPSVLLIVLVILFVFSVKNGISKIVTLKDELKSQKNIDLVLKQKEELLRTVEEGLIEKVNVTNIALPDKNPALFSMYHIKNLGIDGLVVLTNLKVGSAISGDSGIGEITISFDIQGQIADVIDKINQLKNVIPLIILEKVDFKIEGTIASADVSIKSYWSPFPDKIPSLTQPLSDITSEEKSILESLLSLTRPSFDQLLPQEAQEREDPFR